MRVASLIAGLGVFCALASPQAAGDAVADQVRSAEQAFAGTMAARDHAAFSRHIAEDAVFFDGEKAIRGKAAVVAAWKAFFERTNAPFSWAPDNDRIAFAGSRNGVWNVYTVSRTTKEIRQLTNFTSMEGYVRYPSWSLTRPAIVFERAEQRGSLWSMTLP